MSSFVTAPKKRVTAPKKRKSILKEREITTTKKERPTHSVDAGGGIKEHFINEDSDAGTCTNYGTRTEEKHKLHDVYKPDMDKCSPNKTPSDAKRVNINCKVYTRQRSLQDENLCSVLGTHVLGEDVHCPLSKNVFF